MAANPLSLALAPVLPTDYSPKAQAQRCEDEPIRTPGSVQRHGFLVLLDQSDQHIAAASENSEEFLQLPLALILGTPVETFFEREVLGALRALADSAQKPGMPTYLGAFPMRGRLYTVVTHCVGHQRLVEFELLHRLVSPELTNQVFTNFVSKLGQIHDEKELCQALCEQVKNLTGFNRILLYSFDEVGHGTVICEKNDGVLPSYLDLRFPASDIPQQARDLYVLNTVRIIPDAGYIPSPIRGQNDVPLLDLSTALLRSVSPIHLQYMQNMGTLASMSISIIIEGKLWGLISGHHAQPHTVPYLVRSACDLLTKLVCTQIIGFRSSANLRKMVHFHAVQRTVLTQMAAENNYLNALSEQMQAVIQITDAEGAALVLDGQCESSGKAPADADIERLASWLDDHPELEIFETSNLETELDWAGSFKDVASGLLAIRISYSRQGYLMWFRPEVLRTVNWAGEPKTKDDPDSTLRPRFSFDSWKELVSGKSTRWSDMEVESATDFRSAVMTISLKRAEQAVQLGEARFLQLTHSLPNPVWTADDAGYLTYVNQKWLEQGMSETGRWYQQANMISEDQIRCGDIWHTAVARGDSFDLEVRFRSAPATAERWNLVRAIPYLHAGGARAGWVGTCTDLTDRRHRESALRMTEKLALTGRMTSVIAHEINNPLEAITNLLYLLGDHVKDNEEARSYIGLAESELQRISGITKQTLRWARESGHKPEYGSAHALFTDVLRLYAGQIRNRQVNVVIHGSTDSAVYGILGQLTQVLANLVSNAVQAAPINGRIWLSSATHGDTTEFSVRDEGSGMDDETLRNLFQPFYSTKGDLGNGLGLYISHEIVERHHGSLTIDSAVGRGTDVRVRIPASPILEQPVINRLIGSDDLPAHAA